MAYPILYPLTLGELEEKGYKTFKCASPGCRKKATCEVVLRRISYRFLCTLHAEEQEAHFGGRIVGRAPQGQFIYRKDASAHGGWKGWTYRIPSKD